MVFVLGDVVDLVGVGPNRTAADGVVAELRSKSAVKKEHEAAVVAFISLATAVDALPSADRLWSQYREAEQLVRAIGAEVDDGDEDWTANTATVGTSQVRNAKGSGKGDVRPAGRGRGKTAGQGADAVPAARVGRGARGRS